MNNSNQETEVKFYIQNPRALEYRLAQAGAELRHPRVYERNVRYEDIDKVLISNGIVLRLREDSRVRLTYKAPGDVQNGIVSRPEWEVEVGDFATMATILVKLGFFPAMTYEKYRTTYRLNDTEVVLDEMPFGYFAEIEGTHETIEAAIKTLELTTLKRFTYSYLRLFEHVKYHLELDFNDLTFNNFDGLLVPESAFLPPEK
jgi:adenylate cyclase class 2